MTDEYVVMVRIYVEARSHTHAHNLVHEAMRVQDFVTGVNVESARRIERPLEDPPLKESEC